MNGFLRLLMYVSLVSVAGEACAAGKKAVVVAVSSSEVVTTVVTDGTGTVSVAPTAEQAEAAYQNARRSFLAVASGAPDVSSSTMDTGGVVTVEDNIAGGRAQNIALENIRIVMDVDNVTLREVMQKIVQQAAAYTGPWTVKWRLRPENMDLMTERVNLTTEANFGDFCSLLTERVKNMTGTQLFVTAFASSRVLLVADTFY